MTLKIGDGPTRSVESRNGILHYTDTGWPVIISLGEVATGLRVDEVTGPDEIVVMSVAESDHLQQKEDDSMALFRAMNKMR